MNIHAVPLKRYCARNEIFWFSNFKQNSQQSIKFAIFFLPVVVVGRTVLLLFDVSYLFFVLQNSTQKLSDKFDITIPTKTPQNNQTNKQITKIIYATKTKKKKKKNYILDMFELIHLIILQN